MRLIAEELLNDKEIQEYISIYMKNYGKVPPPLCLWDGETIDEYRERLRKLVEQEDNRQLK